MEQVGMILGIGLLMVVTVWALLLAKKAQSGVEQFRDEHHESFLGRGRR